MTSFVLLSIFCKASIPVIFKSNIVDQAIAFYIRLSFIFCLQYKTSISVKTLK